MEGDNAKSVMGSESITILHVLKEFEGDYSLFNQTIWGFKEGFKHIVCYLCGPPDYNNALCQSDHDVRWLPYRKNEIRKFNFGVVKELKKIIRNEQVDIVHAQRTRTTLYALLSVWNNKEIALVSTVHGMKRTRTMQRKFLNRILWRRLDKIIAVSEAVKQDILLTNSWLEDDKIAVIYNGLNLQPFLEENIAKNDARSFFHLPRGKWLWGAVGRLESVKGHDVLLKVWAREEVGKKGAHLVIAGEGTLRDSLENLTKDLGIVSQVTFLGHVTDVAKLHKSLDAFVMPSRSEAFGLSLLEAMASGVPVVASDYGGMVEILEPLQKDEYCYLVPPEDEIELGRAMQKLMAWPAAHYQLSRRALTERALFFSSERMVSQLSRLYREILSVRK